MSKFLDDLKCLIEKTDHIDKDDAKKAADLVRHRRWQLNLRREGCCLTCKTEFIQYGKPCNTHIRKGDGWLDSLSEKWKNPPNIRKRYGRHLTANGYRLTTITPYLCVNCRANLDEYIAEFENQETQRRVEVLRQNKQHEISLLVGDVKGMPAKRFWALQSHVSSESIKRLKEMPYQEFLDTIYWEVVRKYVLWKRKYRCELCGENGELNVHHKSYDYRGEEYNHLEDLIVLCQPCHAKFHDKLAA